MAGELLFPTINSVIFSGRITRDLELRYTASGTPVLNLPLACDRFYKNAQGETQQQASFIDVVVWSKQAENCVKYLSKGSPVIVEGYLQSRSYTDRNNNKRKLVEVVAQRVNFLEKSQNFSSTQSNSNNNDNNFTNNKQNNNNQANEITEDDVPF